MYGWRGAPFLLHKDSFSCRDAHAFNRVTPMQVTEMVHASEFMFVSY
jgi:hypothetical protein